MATSGTEVAVGQRIKKHKIGLWLKVADDYKRIKKSKSLEIATEAETETEDFIASATPQETLKNYKVYLAQDLAMIKGEDDFEFIWEHFYKDVAEGNETKVEVLIVFMFDGDATEGYKAWKTDAGIIFQALNGVESKIDFNINFGDITQGKVTVEPSSGKLTFK